MDLEGGSRAGMDLEEGSRGLFQSSVLTFSRILRRIWHIPNSNIEPYIYTRWR
jgi:hypothetical protein